MGAPAKALHHRRVDNPGAHGIDSDIGLRVVQGGRLAEADRAVFRGDVRSPTCEALDPGTRGGVHNRAAALFEHQRDLVLHAQEHAAEVDGDDPVPLLLRDIGHRRCRLFNTGVVEGGVQPPEGFDGLIQSRRHVLGARHVAPDGERPSASLFDHPRRFLIVLFRNVGDHHAGTLTRERQRRGTVNAVGCSSDKGNLARKASILVRCHVLLLSALLIVRCIPQRQRARERSRTLRQGCTAKERLRRSPPADQAARSAGLSESLPYLLVSPRTFWCNRHRGFDSAFVVPIGHSCAPLPCLLVLWLAGRYRAYRGRSLP